MVKSVCHNAAERLCDSSNIGHNDVSGTARRQERKLLGGDEHRKHRFRQVRQSGEKAKSMVMKHLLTPLCLKWKHKQLECQIKSGLGVARDGCCSRTGSWRAVALFAQMTEGPSSTTSSTWTASSPGMQHRRASVSRP